MDFISAAYRILENAGEPLHYKEIARRALANGLIETSGKTPEATLGARLYTDIKKEDSRFKQVSRATFGLKSRARVDDIGLRAERINDAIKQEIRARLYDMLADRFETLIGELLVQIGFDEQSVHVTSFSNDRGIDVRGILNAGDITEVNAAVQVKKWRSNVGSPTVRNLRGSLTTHEQGIIITTSDFSRGAREEANAVNKTSISLVNGEELVDLMIKHSVGITKERYTVISLDDEWWDVVTGAEYEETIESVIEEVESPTVVFPLNVMAMNNPEITAQLLNIDGQMLFNGTQYSSTSAAGMAAAGWSSCNGWRYWKYQDSESLEWRFINDIRIRE